MAPTPPRDARRCTRDSREMRIAGGFALRGKMTIVKEGLARDAFADIAEPGELAPVTPGEVLREEFMAPFGLSARQLARDLGVSPDRITEIMRGERAITAETALLLARRFGTSARFWLNLQVAHDLAVAERAADAA